ncbi:probable 2' cyclic ADP-D-ribose synthase BdTIR [Magnolia sinica]|uniref:probable 2' cyclic ADP-D-ribose synthase BdTIR n=1 Tax=Magnolia sinica TaxID=86752 RepID=UPI0026591DD9|nr:probable 2' cyclic ADP-D-ribose synthase BdTIR [Magnolia sinica]
MSMPRFLSHQISSPLRRACDVFINHRGVDTKKTVAGLLYHRLSQLNINAFLDSKSMQPGDRLYESIGSAIRKSKIGVVVFSPRYCDSYFCLHELALLVDQKKKLIPIFCDVKPSELQIMAYEKSTPKELVRFRKALEEARYTVGFVFDSQNGNWSDLVTNVSDIIVKSLNEQEGQKHLRRQGSFIVYLFGYLLKAWDFYMWNILVDGPNWALAINDLNN